MNEKLQILKMVEAGQITVEEAAKLLEALGEEKNELSLHEDDNSGSGHRGSEAKWLRIRVSDETDNTKVNVNIPVALVDIGLKLGSAYNKELENTLHGIDIQEVIRLIKEGAEGKIIDIETNEGEKVEIIVE